MIVLEIINALLRAVITSIVDNGNPDFAIPSSQQNAPRPIGPYCSVAFVTSTGRGWEESIYTDRMGDDDVDQNISRQLELMFSFSFYRGDANDTAHLVRIALTRDSIQRIFSQGGLALTSRSQVRKISLALEDTWEERSQFDIVINTVETDADIVSTIGTVLVSLQSQFPGSTYNTDIEA